MDDLVKRLGEVAASINNDALILHAEYTVPEAKDRIEEQDALLREARLLAFMVRNYPYGGSLKEQYDLAAAFLAKLEIKP